VTVEAEGHIMQKRRWTHPSSPVQEIPPPLGWGPLRVGTPWVVAQFFAPRLFPPLDAQLAVWLIREILLGAFVPPGC
jgi:hypothetical protein